MRVRRLMIPTMDFVTPWTEPRDAAAEMLKAGIDCLPVIESRMIVGVITAERIGRAVASRRPNRRTGMMRAMSTDFCTCRPDDMIDDAVEDMLSRNVGHSIVVDRAGHSIGLLSLARIEAHRGRRAGGSPPRPEQHRSLCTVEPDWVVLHA